MSDVLARVPRPAARGNFGVRHLAIIMDGNGRWAAQRGLPRGAGHRAGVEALRATVRNSIDLGISVLTVYSFSLENWSRPADEVADLMSLLKRFIRKDLRTLHEQNVRMRVIGLREALASEIGGLLREAEETTQNNTGLTLVVAFNYGARQEIVAAARRLAVAVAEGRLQPEEIDAERFEGALETKGLPDPDLIIRTSGEIRLSNFLLWQAAYSEFVFSQILWPDFDRAALEAALAEFGSRKRRFGGLDSASTAFA